MSPQGGGAADHFVAGLVVIRGGVHDHGLDGLDDGQSGVNGGPLRSLPGAQQAQAHLAVGVWCGAVCACLHACEVSERGEGGMWEAWETHKGSG